MSRSEGDQSSPVRGSGADRFSPCPEALIGLDRSHDFEMRGSGADRSCSCPKALICLGGSHDFEMRG